MDYTSLDIANAFLKLANRDAITDMTHMKLQKLVFFAQLVSVISDKQNPLHQDETVAWDYGPVVPVLYNKLKRLGRTQITLENTKDVFSKCKPLDETAQGLINAIWAKLKDRSPVQLSAITHRTNTPWYVVYYKTNYGIITHDIMEQYKFGEQA